MCCLRCGALAASHNLRSGLFEACPAATAGSWTLPEGSKGRLKRFRQGKHPEGSTAAVWPDGRSAVTIVSIKAIQRVQVSDDDKPLTTLLAEPDDQYDSLVERACEEQQREARIQEIREIIQEEIEAITPGAQLLIPSLTHFAQEECKAGITRLLARMIWPATHSEEASHFSTAQLLAWPAQGESSLEGFSNSVLAVVESIDALQSRLQQEGSGYPEEHALFSDTPRSHDVELAATFVASVQDTLWEPNEATSYVSDQLQKLASG